MRFKEEFKSLLETMDVFCYKELDGKCLDALYKNGMYLYDSDEEIELLRFLDELENYTETVDDERGVFEIINKINELKRIVTED